MQSRPRMGGFGDWFVLFGMFGMDEPVSDGAIRTVIYAKSGRKRVRRQPLAVRLSLMFALFSTARSANAEDPAVLTPIELFEPSAGEGIRVSPGLVLKPQVALDLTHDSNIYNTAFAERSDTLASLRPRLVLESDFSRHALQFQAGGDLRRYFKTSDENSEAFDASALAKLELGQRIDVVAQAGYLRDVEARGTAGDLFTTDTPVVYHQKNAKLAISRMGPRFGLSATGQVIRKDYRDAAINNVPVDLSFRDVTLWSATGRADWPRGERMRFFAEVGANRVRYEQPGVPSRNSNGYALLGGVHYEASSLVDLEVAAGYIRQNFKNPLFAHVSGFNYRLTANWTPRPTWKITAMADRVVDPSPLNNVPAIIKSSFKLGAQHALSDKLLLEAEGGRVTEDYSTTPRNDRRWYVQGLANYRLTNRIGLIGSVGYRKQDGGLAGRSYKGLALSAGVRAAW